MDRRDFIRIGAALGALLSGKPGTAAQQTPPVTAGSTSARAGARDSSRKASPAAVQSTPAADDALRADYIVVGSGAGGGTVAARLAEAGYTRARPRSRRRSADDHRLQSAASRRQNTYPDDYDVPAFHPLATENDAIRWDFFVRHYDDDAQQRQDPKYVEDYNGKRGRRHLVSARGRARRLHRAQRDDLRLPAQHRLEPARRPDRAIRPGAPSTCGRTSSASRTAGTGRSRAASGQARRRIRARHGWAGWLHTEKAQPRGRDSRSADCADGADRSIGRG